MKPKKILIAALLAAVLTGGPAALADAVTDWNAAVESSLANPAERGPRVPVRTLAIMHVAMFDAVNGIEGKYHPAIVTDSAPKGADAEAAAIQAAYTVLSALLPAHQAAYDAQLATSLATLPAKPHYAEKIARGREWGTTVAHAVIAARANDGSAAVLPAFVGETGAGFWRHVPLGNAATAGYFNLVMTPFVLPDPAAFDPGPPYGIANRADALASASYTADVNEIKAHGGAVSALRTADETAEALFLHAADVASLNHLLRSRLHPQARLVENARAFALLNMTAIDAPIVFYRAKYKYAFWRPFQAINFAEEDNNPATEKDAAWTPLVAPTPSHPEYPSAHVTIFSALTKVTARLVGDCGEVELVAPGFAEPRTYENLEAIPAAAIDARVNIGYHFRETCEISVLLGEHIGDYIAGHALRPLHGRCNAGGH